MRKTLTIIGLGAVLAFAFGTAQAELLQNANLDRVHAVTIVPGFELPKPDVWQRVETRSITGAYEDGSSSEPWAGPAPTPVTTDGFLNTDTRYNTSGDYAVFFKAFSGNASPNGSATVHLYQDVPGTAGDIYTLSAWAGGEANFMGGAELALEFLNAGMSVIGGGSLDLNLEGLLIPNGQPFNYKQYSVTAQAPAGTAFVRARASMLNGIANPLGGGQAFVVDDFSLVPEPATALLLVAALVLRRR